MFEVRGLVQHGLGLVLQVAFEFALEIINKSPGVSEVLSEKVLKFKPCH